MSQLQTISKVLKENEGLEGTPRPPSSHGRALETRSSDSRLGTDAFLRKPCSVAFAQVSQARETSLRPTPPAAPESVPCGEITATLSLPSVCLQHLIGPHDPPERKREERYLVGQGGLSMLKTC